MGIVWLAKDERLGETLALKLLPAQISGDPVALDDMRRETLKSRRLTHPNIIRIHDIFESETEPCFISMEYVDGPNLSSLRLKHPDRLFIWDYLAPLVKQLCDALDYAHSEKVIHRDLKPANMMLDSRGRLKLADFGIAAVVSDSMSRISLQHATSGTVTYMSPQQMNGQRPQPSDDIYALGATLYELLTSRPPFYQGDIVNQVQTIEPQPMADRLTDLALTNEIPPAVSAMVMACLSKDPAQRPQSAGAVAEWIGLQAATQPSRLLSVNPEPASDADEPTAEAVQTEVLPEEEAVPTLVGGGKTGLWVGVGLAAGLVLGLGGWWAMREKGKTQTPTAKAKPAAPLIAPLESAVPGPKQTETIDLGGGIKMEFVFVRPGSFMMGSDTDLPVERPVHKVTLTKPFYLGKFEVTQEQWQSVMGNNPSFYKGLKLPIDMVSWNDCQSFLAKLQAKTGRKFALPTEAQWEYACRAGTTTRYSFGDSETSLAGHGWFFANTGSTTPRISRPVGEKKPNPWGLHDMHGNVWEWCADWFADSYPSGDATDPQGASWGSRRVLRGGALDSPVGPLRSSNRYFDTPAGRSSTIGFRCVLREAAAGQSKQASAVKAAPVARPESTVPVPKQAEIVDLGGGIGMEFLLIYPGSFTMGSDIPAAPGAFMEQPVHKVTLTRPFYLGKFEVTQEQWQSVMGNNPSGFKGPRLPVESVSWNDCQSFLAQLQTKTGRKFTLPTEAQWEYACRAGTTTRYSFGESDASLAEHGWFRSNSSSTTHSVGEKRPNPWGLYDMHGNVWEWCADWYINPYPNGAATDPQGASSGNFRVLRGGAWLHDSDIPRSSYRGYIAASARVKDIGVRCVMAIGMASP